MKVTTVYLLVLAVLGSYFVNAQSPATQFSGFPQRTITLETFKNNEVLPPCYEASYTITNSINPCSVGSNGVLTYSNLLVNFFPTSSVTIPAPTDDITINLYAVVGGVRVPVPVSHLLDDTLTDGTHYVVDSCSIAIDGVTVIRSPSNVAASTGCGIGYYCSDFCDLGATQFVVVIGTGPAENDEGIIYNLAVNKVDLAVQKLTLGTTSRHASFVPNSENPNFRFLATQWQHLYYVDVGPSGNTLTAVANYLAQASGYVDLSFRVSGLTVNGASTVCTCGTGSCDQWDLYVRKGDLTITPSALSASRTDTVGGCPASHDTEFLCSTNYLEVLVGGCDSAGRYFVSVAYPVGATLAQQYDITVQYLPINDQQVIPTFATLSTNTDVADFTLGEWGNNPSISFQEAYVLLNFAKTAATDDLFVTVYGIDTGSISATISQTTLGYHAACDEGIITCQTRDGASTRDDYCKLKIPGCAYNPSINAPYWVTIRVDNAYTYQDGYDYVEFSENTGTYRTSSFSVNAQVVPIDVRTVTSLAATSTSTYNRYVDVTTVNEQAYIHYVLNVPRTGLTRSHRLQVVMYPNNEQEEVILAYNAGSFAGSATPVIGNAFSYLGLTPKAVDNGPLDSCFQASWVCGTAGKESTFETFSYSKNVGSCSAVLAYCDLLASDNHYFSVYGVDSSPTSEGNDDQVNGNRYGGEVGYERSVSYTIEFTLWSAPDVLNVDETINVQVPYAIAQPNGFAGLNNYYTQQFRFDVPADNENYFVDRVRIRLASAIQSRLAELNDEITLRLSINCADTAGDCPCFTKYDSCDVVPIPQQFYYDNDNFGTSCDVTVPFCECPSGVFYASVESIGASSFPGGFDSVFTLTAYYDEVELRDDIVTVPSTLTGSLIDSEDNKPIDVNFLYGFDVLIDRLSSTTYDSHLYRLRIPDDATTQALKITLKTVPRSHTATGQLGILSISRDTVSPAGFGVSDCSRDCFVEQGDFLTAVGSAYCSIVYEPCDFEAGDYYIRVTGLSGTAADSFDFRGLDYTVHVETVDYAPKTLAIPSAAEYTIGEYEQNHYSLSLSGLQANQWLRVALYLDADQTADDRNQIRLFYNFDAPAGDNCYSSVRSCLVNSYSLESAYCDIFFAPCELKNVSTLYLSARSEYYADVSYQSVYYPSHIVGNQRLRYSLSVATGGVVALDDGHPRKANLLARQEHYYSFTIPTNAANILHVQVQSTEPYRNDHTGSITNLKTSISKIQPENGISYDCPCSDIVFEDEFTTTNYPCELTSQAGTYYIKVRALFEGADFPRDPISYTVRVWWTPIQSVSLALGTTFTKVPQPLNYNQWIDYSITVPSGIGANQVLSIEIADITDSTLTNGNDGILVFLSNNGIASPDNHFSLWSYGNTVSGCHRQVCALTNTDGDDAPAPNNVMYAAEFTPCNTCGNTFHLTIKPRLYEPQPSILNRVNFTVRAYLRDVTIPVGFVDSATLRTQALLPGGYTYNFDFNTPLVNYDKSYVADGFDCDGFSRDYYFRLPSLSVQSFEDLVVTLPGVDANPQLSWELSADPGASLASNNAGCDDFSGAYGDCSAAATFNLYGVIGLHAVSNDPFNLTTAGASINFKLSQDNVYALPPSTPTTSLPTVDATVGPHTLTPGQYRVYSFQYISTLLTTVSEVTLTPTASAGTPTYCVSYGAADATFPCTCQPFVSIFLEPCCVANNTQVFITVFNNNNNGNDATFSIDVDVETYARGITALPIPTNAGSTGAVATGGLYDIYSFTLTRANFAPDAVLNFRFSDTSADAVTRTVYLNLYELAGDNADEDCLGFFYQCNVGDDDCFIQLPQCFFPTPYGTYYFSVVSADGTSANSGTTFSLFVTNPTVISVGGSAVQGTVPDISSAPVDYLTHFKFQYARLIGELGPEDTEFGLRLVLTANSLTNNLQLFIADSRLNGQNNVLAGPAGILTGGCSYSNSFVGWDCDATTLTASGSITCDAVFCDNSVWNWATLANEFIYVSVQNLDNSVNRVATPFSITVSRVSANLPVDEAIFPITPRVANTDVESNVACSLSANSFGCNFVQSSFVQLDTAYFRVDLSDIASWGETDYLLVNITNFNGNLDLDWFLSDQCESAASGITCNPSSPDLCFLDSDPCTWRSSFLALPGTNAIIRNAYVRVQWSGSVDFHIEIHRVTPARNTIVLSAASPSYTNTFVMWDERYAMFNFELPQTGTYDFNIEVDTECVDPTFEPEIYVNRFEYRWATAACSERASHTDFEETIPHCKVGGNYFITVVGPRRAVDYPVAVTIPEGNVSPQIRFTISATITPHSWTPYAWECTTDLITTSSKNYLAYADAENFGTQLAVGLTDCGSSCSLKIISPLYRSVYNVAPVNDNQSKRGTFYNTINQPQAAYNDEFYILNENGCAVPSCDSEGVYCCDTTDSCFIELDTCEFRNGRWFIYVEQAVPSAGVRLSSTIDRKDIPILTVGSANSYHSIVHSEIRNAPFASNGLGYAQYYKVVADGTQKYLDINVGINIPEDELHQAFEECFWSYNPDIELSANDCAALARKRMIVSISSGDYGYSTAAFGSSSGVNGITAASCSDVSYQCITNPLSRQCTYRAEVCEGNTFYVAVYSDYDFNNIDCRSLPYYVEVVGNTPNYQTITPGVPVCGTVWNIESRAEFILNEFYISDTLKYNYDPSKYYYEENYFYLAQEDDDAQNYDFPSRIMYKVDTTGIDLAFANLQVSLEQYHGLEDNSNLVLSYSNKPASAECHYCVDTTFGSDDDDFAGFNVNCGLDNIWITVEVNQNTPHVPATDYWLRVDITPRAKQTITVPSLTGHTVSTVSASFSADETIFTVDNTVQQRIITGVSAPFFAFVEGDNKRTGCSDSCPSISSCDRAAAKPYYIVGGVAPKPDSDCETVSTPASTLAVTFQNVVPLTVNQATAGAICGTDAISVHYYSVAVPTDNTFLGFTFDLLGATGHVELFAACDQDPLHGCQDWHLAFGAGSIFRDYSCHTCSRVIIAVVPSFCDFECTRYTLQVNSVARDTALSSTSLTTQWLGGAIQRYGVAPSAQFKDYTVTAGTDGFVHVAIGNVNGTSTNEHEGLLEIYRGAPSDNCLVASCFSGSNIYLDSEVLIDDDNNEDHSCFVHFAGTPGQVYTARVSPDDSIQSSWAGLFYRVQAFTAFTPLTATASAAVLQGTNRHYYSVAGVSASGAPQSVVVHLNVDNGPRLLVEVADSPSYRFAVDNSNIYNGWSQAKTCYFGECTIEVATTAAQHPGAAVFYVWITPVAPAAGESGIEKESVYRISATTGAGNCVASGSLTSSAPFCASNLASGSSYFAYRSASQRDSEASCRYDSLLCRCTAPLPTCQTALKRFSCLESFRECDANGFWTPVCRGECSAVEASCGSWLPDSLDALSTTCSCGRSEFSCGSSRYADAETCTGANPAPSPSPVPVVSSEETTEEATSDVYYDDDSSDNTNSNTNSKTTRVTSDGSTIQTTVTTARASSDASRVGVWSAALALFALLSVLFF